MNVKRTLAAILAAATLTGSLGLSALAKEGETALPEVGEDTQAVFYVSPTGNAAGDGSEENPFGTLEQARDAVREINDDMTGDIRVILRGGTYTLDETLEFTSEDSATNGYTISYEAAPGETPVLSGGREITGWEEVGNGIYKTNVGDLRFRQLYVNGEYMPRATTRDVTKERPWSSDSNYFPANWDVQFYSSSSPDEGWAKLRVPTEYFDLSEIPEEDFGQVEILYLLGWSEAHLRLKDFTVDGSNQIVTFQENEERLLTTRHHHVLQNGDKWPMWLENALAFLDQPTEWFLNNQTGELYYMPQSGQSMDALTVTAPCLETLVEVKGTREEPVRNLEMHGITFQYSNWADYPNSHGLLNAQAGNFNIDKDWEPRSDIYDKNLQWVMRPAAGIYVSYTDNFVFERNIVENMGATGLDLHYGTRNSQIEGNIIRNISGNGIMIASYSPEDLEFHQPWNPEDSRDISRDDRIANNHIYNIGVDYMGCCAIAAGYVQAVTIEHNTIHDTPYTGITVGWGWHHNQTSPMQYNIIRYNDIYDTCKQMSDGGAIYTLSHQPGSQIVKNYIHDMNTVSSFQGTRNAAIFLDEGTSGYTVKDNVIENLQGNVRRIDRNANSNPITDNTQPLADVLQNAGVEPAYRDMLGQTGKTPVIEEAPETVEQGGTMILRGQNFGTEPGSVRLAAGELLYSATVESWTDTEITAVLPRTVDAGMAQVMVTSATGAVSEAVSVEITAQAGPYQVTDDFESYEAGEALPENTIWSGQNAATVTEWNEGKALKLDAQKEQNASAVLREQLKDYRLTFDVCFDTELPELGDGMYAILKDGQRLEWIDLYGVKTFTFGDRAQKVEMPIEKGQTYTIKVESEGDALRAKVWAKGENEPAEWTVSKSGVTNGETAVKLEFYTSGPVYVDNVSYEELDNTLPPDDGHGEALEIDFEAYAEGELATDETWLQSTTASVAKEEGNKFLRLTSNGANSVATLNGVYKNYDLSFDMRLDTELQEGQSEGLYLEFKQGEGSGNYLRLEILPEWLTAQGPCAIKHGPSTVLGSDPSIVPDYQKWYSVKLSVSGSTILFKIWEKNTQEPTDWMIACEGEGVDTGKISFQYYAANGTMSLDNIQVSNVNFDDVTTVKEIASAETLAGITAPVGTAFQALQLPETVQVTLKDSGAKETVRVVWDSTTYRANQVGTQTLIGELKTSYELQNPDHIRAEIEVTLESQVCDHSGGTATCVSPAICERCGQPYGEKDPDNHVGGTEIRNKKPATRFEEGYTGDVYCKGCEKLLEKGEVIPKKDGGIDWIPSVPDTKPSWELPFTDVAEGAWYYDSVYYAWQEDLIDGVTADKYQPDGSLTVAQAIKLASALHEMLNRGYVTLENGTANWYDTYVDYAVNNGIIEAKYQSYTKAQMDTAITRNEFVHIFHGAMDSYKAINDVKDNAIPDVKMTDAYADEIYDFYRAGILTGSDGAGTFNGKTTIKRSEVATILVRIYDDSMRETVKLP